MMDPDVISAQHAPITRHIGQRRVDDLTPKAYVEPAVADWRAALEASKTIGSKTGNTGTPHNRWG